MTTYNQVSRGTTRKLSYGGILLAVLLAVVMPASSQDRKIETIDTTAMGTSTQLGHTVDIRRLTIYQYSTPEDRKVLVEAFRTGQNPGTG